jgi:hypothetical protein
MNMEQAAWTAIGLLAATLFGCLFYLGSKIDGINSRIDALGARLDARIDSLSNRLDAHLERHAG